MAPGHLAREDFGRKIIDAHAHVGVSIKALACNEYPYAETLEGLLCKQLTAGVDFSVVFPFTPDLFFDPSRLVKGEAAEFSSPLSASPYCTENRNVMMEVFNFNPEHKGRFIPFVSADPGRKIREQVRALTELEEEYPIYGIKIAPVLCQSSIGRLLDTGRPILDFARKRNIPFLLHTTVDESEQYSHFRDAITVVEDNPDIRFCLAHCIGFHEDYLEKADSLENVWVDSSALKIQAKLASENSSIVASEHDRLSLDYGDHRKVLDGIARRFSGTLIWGSDSPAYSYVCRRRQGESSWADFRLKASYADEKAALDFLPRDLKLKISNLNTLDWIFGKK